jgi:hypothetical protein
MARSRSWETFRFLGLIFHRPAAIQGLAVEQRNLLQDEHFQTADLP